MFKRILPLLFVASMADAQNFTINTVGGGGAIVTGQPATSYPINGPHSVAVDSLGNLYVALPYSCQVWVVNSSGALAQVIGNGSCGFSGDNGPAGSAQLGSGAQGVAVDSSGNIYISDTGNNRIRKVSGGIITTVAGNGAGGFSGDGGNATSAKLNYPLGIAVDNSGNLYIADFYNNRIREVSGGVITTVAGGGSDYLGEGISATSAAVYGPTGVAVDNAGNLYVAEVYNNFRVRVVSGGVITTVAGNQAAGSNGVYSGDGGPAISAGVHPTGVAVDNAGNLYISDGYESTVRKVSGGIITTAAGNRSAVGYNGDSISATSAELSIQNYAWYTDTFTALPAVGVAVDSQGNLYIADFGNNRIRKVAGGFISTVVGNGSPYSGDGTVATSTQLTMPGGTAVDSAGNLFIADTNDCVVRKVDARTGIISTVAGNGICGDSFHNVNDALKATSAMLNYPQGVAVDNSGNLYISQNPYITHIYKVSGGIMTNVPVPAEGGIAVDSSGSLYFAESRQGIVSKLSGGITTRVAGNLILGYSGDGGSATSAELKFPNAVAVDSSGNLYIADTGNNRIRKVSGGIITTVAGNGTAGYSGDGGSATSAELNLNSTNAVAVDYSGNLYIADTGNNRIRRVSSGIITTVAGNGTAGYSGDAGSATSAELNSPSGVSVDSSGNVYVSDTNNNRIRVLTPTGGVTVSVNVTSNPSGLTLIIDGISFTTPHSFNWATGSCHTFNASTQPGAAGTQYVPAGVFPANPCFSSTASYNVNFTTQYYLTTAAGAGGTISPPSGWYNSGTVVSVSATAAPGYRFAVFSGALTGATNPQFLTMNAAEAVTANFALTFLTTSRVGVFRDVVPSAPAFLEDSNGDEQYIAGSSRFINAFIPPGGGLPGDIDVAGDWTGDGRYKVGIFRPLTGQWFLDANNDGIFDAGDPGFPNGYNFGGGAGINDIPVVGDWAGIGRSCIGVFRQGFLWILDLNCNGAFDGSPVDAVFPFGGIAGDVPVVGAWVAGQPTRVGVVRKYAPGNPPAPQGAPFFWVLDGANPNAGGAPANHPVATGALAPFPFGGAVDGSGNGIDNYVVGDWLGNGTFHAGIYRNGSWLLDLSGAHTYDTFFQFGGLSTDTPIVGKW